MVMLARLKAWERGAEAVEVVDLLVGFIIEDQGDLVKALFGPFRRGATAPTDDLRARRSLAPSLARDLLARLQGLYARSQPVSNPSGLPLSENVQRILMQAVDYRNELKHDYVEPLHLLAASVDDGLSRSAQIFRQAGITREKVIEFLRQARPSPPPAVPRL
jgi:hypothetical protein